LEFQGPVAPPDDFQGKSQVVDLIALLFWKPAGFSLLRFRKGKPTILSGGCLSMGQAVFPKKSNSTEGARGNL
jgi:hypothetical protein